MEIAVLFHGTNYACEALDLLEVFDCVPELFYAVSGGCVLVFYDNPLSLQIPIPKLPPTRSLNLTTVLLIRPLNSAHRINLLRRLMPVPCPTLLPPFARFLELVKVLLDIRVADKRRYLALESEWEIGEGV